MLSRVLKSHSANLGVIRRSFGTFSPVYNSSSSGPETTSDDKKSAKFSTPQEYIEQKKLERAQEEIFQQNLLEEEFKYQPKYISPNEVDPITGRPIPINVELLKYKPLNLPKTHGHEVAKLKFRGYNEDSLIRAAEFAARSAYYLGIPTNKITSLKTEKRLYTVIKSPFAQAKTKQNFHRTTFNKELVAFDANPEVLDLWLSFVNKHAIEGVEYKASMTTHESLDYNKQIDALAADEFELPQAYEGTTDPVAKKVEELLKSDTFKQFLEEKK
ncbi:mitochondrial ribosomal protein S10 [Scheffersomyces xylosifermentans]|uniref:mitochondrial ribosomal protein S10 n=1 Tax=Scheffersomyces xylosifermentans TaxID=1304137 RepID=UPI00315D9861